MRKALVRLMYISESWFVERLSEGAFFYFANLATIQLTQPAESTCSRPSSYISSPQRDLRSRNFQSDALETKGESARASGWFWTLSQPFANSRALGSTDAVGLITWLLSGDRIQPLG